MNTGFRRCTCIIRQIHLVCKPRPVYNLIPGLRNFAQYQPFQQRLTLPATSLVIFQRSATKKGTKIENSIDSQLLSI